MIDLSLSLSSNMITQCFVTSTVNDKRKNKDDVVLLFQMIWLDA